MSSIGYRREKWSDSSFVARIGKKRRVPPRVEEDRRRKPRASVKGGQGGGRREGTERG